MRMSRANRGRTDRTASPSSRLLHQEHGAHAERTAKGNRQSSPLMLQAGKDFTRGGRKNDAGGQMLDHALDARAWWPDHGCQGAKQQA